MPLCRHKPKPKTRKNLRDHFVKRLKQRYDITISSQEVQRLNIKVRSGVNVVNRARQTHSRTVVDFVFKGLIMRGIYNTQLGSLVTVLPEECLDTDIEVFATSHLETFHM